MSEKIKDHTFQPGDVAYGQELECRVSAPVREAGRLVSACCGYPPEAHVKTDDPKHSRHCDEYNYGDGRPCPCKGRDSGCISCGGTGERPSNEGETK